MIVISPVRTALPIVGLQHFGVAEVLSYAKSGIVLCEVRHCPMQHSVLRNVRYCAMHLGAVLCYDRYGPESPAAIWYYAFAMRCSLPTVGIC